MKSFRFSKMISLGILSLSLAALPLTTPVSAQNAPADRSTTTAPSTVESNWGWVGLLGLIGLVGLAGTRRKHEEPTRYRDPNTTTETEYRQ